MEAKQILNKHHWLSLIGISLITFTAFLDFTIVNLALPSIQKALNIRITQLQWISNIYFITLSVLMITTGKLGDILGCKRVFFMGAILFAIASLICGFAPSSNWLIFGRLFQGVAASSLFTLGATLVSLIFKGDIDRNRAMTLYSTINGLGIAFGPSLGGVIISLLSWRWIFFINVPIIVIGFFAGIQFTKQFKFVKKKASIDWLGMLLLSLFIGGLVLGLIYGAEAGWDNPLTLTYFITSFIGFCLLIPVELKTNDPLLRLSYFTRSSFLAGIICCVLGGMIVSVLLFFDPLFLRVVRNDSVLNAGLILLAMPIMTFFTPLFINTLMKKFTKVGTIMISVFLTLITTLMHTQFYINIPLWFLILALAIAGIAWSIVNTTSSLATHDAVTPDEYGVATGTVYCTFNIAGSIGLALAVAIFYLKENTQAKLGLIENNIHLSRHDQHLFKTLLSEPEKLISIVKKIHNSAHEKIIFIFKSAFTAGFHNVMWLLFGFAVCAFVFMTLILYRIRSKQYKNSTE